MNIKTLAITAFLIVVPCTLVCAVQLPSKIDSPKQCPEGLSIKSKATNGMIEFDVSVDAEKLAHADELYKGRVNANAFLRIATAGQETAFVHLHGGTEGKRTSYHFRISPSAVQSSELQLGVHLFEKDGMATVGGGVSMQIFLAGFQPAMSEQAKPK